VKRLVCGWGSYSTYSFSFGFSKGFFGARSEKLMIDICFVFKFQSHSQMLIVGFFKGLKSLFLVNVWVSVNYVSPKSIFLVSVLSRVVQVSVSTQQVSKLYIVVLTSVSLKVVLVDRWLISGS